MRINKSGSYTSRQVLLALLTLAAPLAGCAMSDDNLSRALVAPGRYTLYTCPELYTEAKSISSRQHELEGLMAKAGTGVGGEVANSLTYRPDYLSNRGLLRDVHEEAATKNCNQADVDKAIADGAKAPASGPVMPPPDKKPLR
jgi:hypothetical protein